MSPEERRSLPAPRRAALSLGSAFALLPVLVAGCGGETTQASDTLQAPPQAEPEFVDLARLGFDAGNEETAALGVIEFSDFGCVFCAAFHEESYPALHEEFVESGDVLWKYIPITIGGFPNGELAGLAGVCAGQMGDFAPMRDHLYEQREEWLASNRGPALFEEYAGAVGLDAGRFSACMTGEEARTELELNDRMARTIGVSGTPTFVVAGTPVRGAPALESFQEVLRNLVGEARQATPN